MKTYTQGRYTLDDMIDPNHLPDNKYMALIKPLIILFAAWDMSVLGFFGEVLTWGARIFSFVFCFLWSFEYIMNEYRYRKWRESGFDPKQKDNYRIK